MRGPPAIHDHVGPLHAPRHAGNEALRIIKNDTYFKKIPVIVLSISHARHDVTQSYHDGANSYFRKPLEYPHLVKLVGLVKKYWLEEVHLPA